MSNKHEKLIALIDTAVEHINACFDEAYEVGGKELAHRVGHADTILLSIQDELEGRQ